jgi:hypothetical protein
MDPRDAHRYLLVRQGFVPEGPRYRGGQTRRLLATALASLSCGPVAAVSWHFLGAHVYARHGPSVILNDVITRNWLDGYVAKVALVGYAAGVVLGSLTAALVAGYVESRQRR